MPTSRNAYLVIFHNNIYPDNASPTAKDFIEASFRAVFFALRDFFCIIAFNNYAIASDALL